MKCFLPCIVVVSNEFIIEPNREFTVKKVYDIETDEMKPATMITNKPKIDCPPPYQLTTAKETNKSDVTALIIVAFTEYLRTFSIRKKVKANMPKPRII